MSSSTMAADRLMDEARFALECKNERRATLISQFFPKGVDTIISMYVALDPCMLMTIYNQKDTSVDIPAKNEHRLGFRRSSGYNPYELAQWGLTIDRIHSKFGICATATYMYGSPIDLLDATFGNYDNCVLTAATKLMQWGSCTHLNMKYYEPDLESMISAINTLRELYIVGLMRATKCSCESRI
jgi:hypothetical protein